MLRLGVLISLYSEGVAGGQNKREREREEVENGHVKLADVLYIESFTKFQ